MQSMESFQMDVFLEQIVPKRPTLADLLKKSGIIVGGILLIFIVMFILPMIDGTVGDIFATINFFLAAGAIFGMYWLITNMNIEYEYIMTNGEIDIDKIISRKKRKRLITVNAREFSEFGKFSENTDTTGLTVIMACGNPRMEDTYYAKTTHQKHGNCMVVFSPNEKIMKSIKQYARRNIFKV